jgi:transposase
VCGLLHIISGSMLDIRQAILKQLEQSGLTINQLAKRVDGKIGRRTVYAYLRGEEDSLSKNVSILLDAVGLTITTKRTKKRSGKEQKK